MYCPCKDCLLIPACRYRTFAQLQKICKPLSAYFFRYCQDTGPAEVGGYYDRIRVAYNILSSTSTLYIEWNPKAVKIMMEDGDDKPISVYRKMQRMHSEKV